MIDELITALSKELELSAEEIADTLWLALHIGQGQFTAPQKPESKQPDGEKLFPPPEPQRESPQESQLETAKEDKSKIKPSAEAKAFICPKKGNNIPEMPFKVPDAPSLREPLTLARALKPLMRRISSGREEVLDEAATTQRIADERIWLPVLTSAPEPWLDLELVIDEGISLQIWHHTIGDLIRLLKNYGIFRDVRVWGLVSDEGEIVKIRRRGKNQPLSSPSELIDSSNRRLVLLVSDCVSSSWRRGKVTPALEIWAKRGMLAIIQMLPKWWWSRTALGMMSEVKLRSLNLGDVNQQLIVKRISFWEEINEQRGIKVPVFTLEGDKVANWAQMLTAKADIWVPGFIFRANEASQGNGLWDFSQGELTAERRVQGFRLTASPMARKLAGLLAAAPVITLPVVRLIQETLLRDCLQSNVAEVFLGGLLKPLSEINSGTNPDDVRYGFMEGVGELLMESVPTDYVLEVISKFLEKRVGLSLREFLAVVRNPQAEEREEELGYFATVTAQVLRRLGGEYGKMADELEGYNKPIKIELIDYNRLEGLLAQGKWEEADEETRRIILQIAGSEHQGGIRYLDSFDSFPCEDLRTLDFLWVHYSQDRFGFSVQRKIYRDLGGTNYYDNHYGQPFGGVTFTWSQAVGWLGNAGTTSDSLPPKGNRPGWGGLVDERGGHSSGMLWRLRQSYLISLVRRLDECSI